MSQKTNKKLYYRSPKGVASYCYLNTPDEAFGKLVYKTDLKVAAEDAGPFVDHINGIAREEFGENLTDRKMPYKVDEETGDVTFTFKSSYPPKFTDTTGTLLPPEIEAPLVFGGSIIKVRGTIYPYTTMNGGIALRMSTVQIIDLNSPDTDKGSMFEPEEGSFTIDYLESASAKPTPKPVPKKSDEGAGKEAYDF